MAAKNMNFCFAKIVMWPKFEKPLSQWNWLKVGEHEYIHIFEIKFEKKNYSVKKWQPKQVLWHCAVMLIYAN